MSSDLRIPSERDLPSGHLAKRRAHLVEELTQTLERRDAQEPGPIPTTARPRSRRSRARARLAPAFAAAAVLAVAALILPSVLLPGGPPAAAAAELRQLAVVAARQPAPSLLGPGRYYYLRGEGLTSLSYVSTKDGAWTVQIPIVREYWVGEDGRGRFVETQDGELIWPGPADKARWEAQGSPPHYGPTDTRGELARGELDGIDLATLPPGYEFETLPRDPEKLYEVIAEAAAASEATPGSAAPEPNTLGTFGLTYELLHTPLTPPAIRSALFEAMAYVPGITIVPEKTIPGMGTGAAVSVFTEMSDGIRVRHEFLVDPATSNLLGYQETQLGRIWWADADPPLVVRWMAYARPRAVDSLTERPA